jgi:hydroxyacylglutathione hydrolase
MISTTNIGDDIYKFTGNDVVNCYLIKDQKIIIDTGNPTDRTSLKQAISKIIELEDIKIVLLTHLHYDHSGNVCLFPNAKFYTSQEEIDAYAKHGTSLTFDMFGMGINDDIDRCNLLPISQFSNSKFEIFFTPGHTPGEISFLYDKIYLFSGDVIFNNGFGRIDFPTCVPEKMEESIKLLQNLKYEVLCPGHDY